MFAIAIFFEALALCVLKKKTVRSAEFSTLVVNMHGQIGTSIFLVNKLSKKLIV